jgi:FkbM family methyltransferase
MIKPLKKKIQHAAWRIKHFKNWHILFPPLNRQKRTRTLLFRDGTRFRVRDVISQGSTNDFSILREVWSGTSKTYPNLSDKDVIFDIGAHIGASTIYIAKNTKAKIYAFEPDRENFNLLSLNIRLNNLNNRVFAFPIALWKEDTDIALSVHPQNKGGHSIAKHHEGSKVVSVQAKTFESFMRGQGIERISFLKCDIEGAEFELFQHTPRSVFDRIDGGLIELHGRDHARYAEIREFLRSMGYRAEFTGTHLQRPELIFHR